MPKLLQMIASGVVSRLQVLKFPRPDQISRRHGKRGKFHTGAACDRYGGHGVPPRPDKW